VTLSGGFFVVKGSCAKISAGVVQPGGVENTLECADKGDFLVRSRFTFEVGGRSKGKEQVAGVADAYLVADDIEVGFGNRIPLWMFGLDIGNE
jgi:hypothetical protein